MNLHFWSALAPNGGGVGGAPCSPEHLGPAVASLARDQLDGAGLEGALYVDVLVVLPRPKGLQDSDPGCFAWAPITPYCDAVREAVLRGLGGLLAPDSIVTGGATRSVYAELGGVPRVGVWVLPATPFTAAPPALPPDAGPRTVSTVDPPVPALLGGHVVPVEIVALGQSGVCKGSALVALVCDTPVSDLPPGLDLSDIAGAHTAPAGLALIVPVGQLGITRGGAA